MTIASYALVWIPLQTNDQEWGRMNTLIANLDQLKNIRNYCNASSRNGHLLANPPIDGVDLVHRPSVIELKVIKKITLKTVFDTWMSW